ISQHFAGVSQRTGRGNHPLLWYRNTDLIIAKSVVKLRIAPESIGSPSINIIIYAHTRIPISQIKEIVFAVPHTATGSLLGHFKFPFNIQLRRFAGHNGFRRTNNHQCSSFKMSLGISWCLHLTQVSIPNAYFLKLNTAQYLKYKRLSLLCPIRPPAPCWGTLNFHSIFSSAVSPGITASGGRTIINVPLSKCPWVSLGVCILPRSVFPMRTF